MPTVREIESRLFQLAPRERAMDWDNVGQLLGDPEQAVEHVLVALDITEDVADEAIRLGCQLIVSHHPVMNCKWLPVQTVRSDTPQGHLLLKLLTHHVSAICMHTNLDAAEGGVKVMNCKWLPVQTVRSDTPQGHLLLKLLTHHVSAICMHTNLDAAEGGVNDCLAEVLELVDPGPLGDEAGLCRMGTLSSPMPVQEFARKVCHALHANGVRYAGPGGLVRRVAVGGGSCGDFEGAAIAAGCDTFVTSDLGALHANGVRYAGPGGLVRRVAVGGGSCGDFEGAAIAAGCDTFVTSDLGYHQFLDAAGKGINLIDAGHFPTEDPVCSKLVDELSRAFPSLSIEKSAPGPFRPCPLKNPLPTGK